MTSTTASEPNRKPHVFSMPVVRENPRPVEPAWVGATW
jgi:hypothetical protein